AEARLACITFANVLPPCRRNQRAFNGCEALSQRSLVATKPCRNEDLSQRRLVATKIWVAVMGNGPNMKWSRAMVLAAFALIAGSRTVLAQAPAQCNAFATLRNDAQQKATAVRTAMEHKAERKEICALVTRFTAAEAAVLKFLEDNKTW